MNLGSFFGSVVGSAATSAASPAEALVTGASKIIEMFKLPPEVKAQLQQQLTLANIDLEKTALAGQIAELQGQLAADTAEAQSKSIFVSGWRPFVGWTCGAAFAWAFVVQPFFNFLLTIVHHPITLPALDLSTMMPVLLGMLGLGAMRSYEKVQSVPDTDKKD